ncbi:MAG: KpsF/GutQ family sugar-phosphate isomerase, partial [Alphaproteobacteria bacterium]
MAAPAKKKTAPSPDIRAAQRVLETEIEGLQKLAASIDHNFTDAITAIHAMKAANHAGRLIIAGIGKSGHVARKIAATMASTGTPAYYVHPGEASHGDLGMIAESDVVLMLSNSGENSELSDLIHYTRRYGIKLIGMTGNPQSTLAKHSDIVLALPKVPEACPNGLAPTTSTTMMLALGDALAVALLERMGLTKEQYKVFHPGGKLGQRLMKVSELMVKLENLPLIDSAAKMDKAILMLTEKNLGAVIVVDAKKKLMGIITDGDLKRHMDEGLLKKPVTKVMTTKPKSVRSDALAVEALDMMTKIKGRYLTSLLVMNDGKLKGMIRLQDCLQA